MAKKTKAGGGPGASERITNQIKQAGGWKGTTLARLRKLILEAAPGITEEWKWDTAVWTQDGMVCSAGTFKDHVKLNFFKGASLKDPKKLFNAGLQAKTTRAIDVSERGQIDEAALKNLVREAVAYNASGGKK